MNSSSVSFGLSVMHIEHDFALDWNYGVSSARVVSRRSALRSLASAARRYDGAPTIVGGISLVAANTTLTDVGMRHPSISHAVVVRPAVRAQKKSLDRKIVS